MKPDFSLSNCSFASSLSWADGYWIAFGTSFVCPDELGYEINVKISSSKVTEKEFALKAKGGGVLSSTIFGIII